MMRLALLKLPIDLSVNMFSLSLCCCWVCSPSIYMSPAVSAPWERLLWRAFTGYADVFVYPLHRTDDQYSSYR